MTTFKDQAAETDAATGPSGDDGKLSLAEILELLAGGRLPLRFTAYDGSAAGPEDAPFGLELTSPRGTTYLATARGDLGLARAYIAGDIEVHGVHPGDPYELLKALADQLVFRMPPPKTMARIVRSIGVEHLRPIAPPPQEVPPRWRRVAAGLRHSKSRDAEAIHHHYDVSNTFYGWVLGPSMTYTCACYPNPDASLEEAQENKYRLVFEKLRLKPGDRLLDVGCGWGGMVRYAARRGVRALGVTLSQEQATWAQRAIADEGLADLAEVRYGDYRDIRESDFDAVSSIGLLEHIGVRNYKGYFRFLRSRLRPGGLLLNHCITRPENTTEPSTHGFIDRYVFPDGELTGSGRFITEAQDAGLEVLHEENLRPHYALTCRAWVDRLQANRDACERIVGQETYRTWLIYLAASSASFADGVTEVFQLLLAKRGTRRTLINRRYMYDTPPR